jgi:tetratricopeptide (TPR) repeat protein
MKPPCFLTPQKSGAPSRSEGRLILLILDADPLSDVRNVRRIRGVMVRGEWLSTEQLQEILDRLKPAESVREQRLTQWLLRGDMRASEYISAEDPFYKIIDWLMVDIAHKHGYRAAIAVYSNYQRHHIESPITDERILNALGYRFLADKQYQPAVAILRENRDTHPYSANACDSLAEAYLRAGNKSEAIRWYSKALEIDPKFDNSRRMLEQLSKTK